MEALNDLRCTRRIGLQTALLMRGYGVLYTVRVFDESGITDNATLEATLGIEPRYRALQALA